MRKKQDIMWEQSTLWESVEKWVTKYLNADKHSPASSARSDCVHEQVAKLGPVSRVAGMDCECPLYIRFDRQKGAWIFVIQKL